MKWYKQDGNSDANPKIQRAGFWGARVYEGLCRISADFELEGRIPAHYADPTYIARRIMATDILPLEEAEEAVAQGLERIAVDDPRWQLVAIDPDGCLTILGWRGDGKDTDALSSTERSRNHRRVKELEALVEELRAKVEPRGNETATPRNATATDATSATEGTNATLEERRGEESREERHSSNSAAAEPDPSAPLVLGLEPEEPPDQRKRFGPAELLGLWNKLAHPAMPRAEKLSDGRKRKAQTRLRENPDPGWWVAVVEAANASPHCRGESRPAKGANKPWRCTFDFIVENDTNPLRILEGAYGDDRQAPPPPDSKPSGRTARYI